MKLNDLTSKDAVIQHMRSSRSDSEWNANAKMVKDANKGQYPSFWYEAIIQTGLVKEIMAKFYKSPDLTIVDLPIIGLTIVNDLT